MFTDQADFKELYFSFQGRITRSTFWLRFVLPALVINLLLGFIDGLIGIGLLSMLFSLAIIWPSIAISAKRWHDRDKSGWWVLIGLIPIVGWIWMLVENGFLPGTAGPNRFGPDPLQAAPATQPA